MSNLTIPIRPAERHLFFDGPLVLISAFVLVELLVPGMSAFFAGWPIVISLFLVGMPHGAADLAVNSHMTGSRTLGERLTKFAGYLVVLLASLVFFLVSPILALILFVLISVDPLRAGRRPRSTTTACGIYAATTHSTVGFRKGMSRTGTAVFPFAEGVIVRFRRHRGPHRPFYSSH